MSIIDLSYWQHYPDFVQVHNGGVTRAIHKCGGGEGGRIYLDSVYQTNRAAARANGLDGGSYFFNGPVDPTAAADFQMTVNDWRPGDVVAIDVESNGNQPRWTPEQVYAWAIRILAHGIPAHLVFAYMSSSALSDRWGNVAALGVLPWVAQYGINDGAAHTAPQSGEWASYALWQYTSSASFPGITGLVDANMIGPSWSSVGPVTLIDTTPTPTPTPPTQEEIDDMTATKEASIIRNYDAENRGAVATALLYPGGILVLLNNTEDVDSACTAHASVYGIAPTNPTLSTVRERYAAQLNDAQWKAFIAAFPGTKIGF